MASWADRAIWWHVYPLGFTGAEKAALAPDEPVRHRLGQLAAWLDYAVDLGCSGLLLGPVFAAESHGYDTVDHFEIDPRLGHHEEPEVLDYVAQVMTYWLDRGASGWRLDAARRRHPWLARGRTAVEHLANETIAVRASADAGSVLVLLNAGDAEFRFPVEVTGLTVAETPARPEDPALVRGHSWVIMSS